MAHEFLLVSDLHVDEYDRFSKIISDPRYGPINSRLYWCLDIFDQIREYGNKRGCQTLLIGGDVFDKRGSLSVRTYNEVFIKIAEMVEDGWEIFAVVGNHDQALKGHDVHALQCFPITFAQTHHVWDSRQGFRVAGVAFHERSGEFFHALKEASKSKPDFYLIHQGLRGAKIAGDEILSRENIALEDIRRFAGDAWIFSGHYHIHQKIDDRFYFIGSSTPKDFGDRTPKGFLHFVGGEIKQIESRAPKFVVVEASELQAHAAELQGQYVQVRYEGPAPEVDLPTAETVVMVPKKVEREYQSRVELSAENSPRFIFGKYLESFNFEPEKMGPIQEALEEVLEGFQFAEKMGSAEVSFEKIKFKNFLRYGDTEINLSELNGLILIEGENFDDPSSVSNGSGKSSIFEGLRWALYGSTLRGLAGDEVVNSQVGADCCVQVEFKVDGQTYRVSRYRKDKKFKNQLLLDMELPVQSMDGGQQGTSWEDIRAKSDKDTTELISQLIGADERVFDNIVFLGYGFNNSFAGLTDKEQKQVLENILGISYLSDLQERAKAKSLELRERCTDHNLQLGYLDRQIEEKRVYVKGLIQRRDSTLREERQKLEREIAAKKEILSFGDSKAEEAQVEMLGNELRGLAEQKFELQQRAGDAEGLAQELEGLKKESEAALRAFDAVIAETRARKRGVETARRERMTKLESLGRSREAGLCPTCLQALPTPEHIDAEIAKLENELAILEKEDLQLSEKIKTDSEARGGEVVALDEIHGAIESTQEALKELRAVELEEAKKGRYLAEEEKNLARLKAATSSAASALARAEKALQELGSQDPYAELIADGQKEIDKLKAQLASRAVERDSDLRAYEAVRFWEVGFSDKGSGTQPPIKSFILESVVPVLDEFARRYSEILSSGSIEVRFNTISRLKSGELREHFSVEVANRYGSVDYRGDSGGERRKVDIAIMFALHALSRIQTGTFFNLVCLDEVLDSLDKEGCDRVAELLRELSVEIQRIFVITHNENLVSKFGSRIKVVKKEGYSTIFDYTSLDN